MVNSSIHFIPISINQLFLFIDKKAKVYNIDVSCSQIVASVA